MPQTEARASQTRTMSTTGHRYAPLRDADELDELNGGFEAWLFRRSTNLHQGLVVGVLVVVATTLPFDEPSMRTADVRNLLAFAVMLVGRTVAHHSPTAHRELARRVCTAVFIFSWVSSGMLDAWTFTRSTVSGASWLGFFAAYLLDCALVCPALALSFAMPPWATIGLQSSLVPGMYLLVQQTPSNLTPTSSAKVMVALSFLASLALGAVVSFTSFAILRQTFSTMGKVSSLADAKSRCVAQWDKAHACAQHKPTHGHGPTLQYSPTAPPADAVDIARVPPSFSYIAAISHDFGTPIAAMRSLLGTLEANEQVIASIGHKQMRRLLGMLELLSTMRSMAIDINKLESGQPLQPERKSFSVRQLTDELMDIMEHTPKKEAVRVTCDVDEQLDVIISDQRWLLLILINFLSNAFKNTVEGVVAVTISVVDGSESQANRRMLRVRVADSGLGVRADLIPHLFQAFAQASKHTFGTGLGLYYVRELASALGGVVQYERNEPRGACFWVDVPFHPVNEGCAEPLSEVVVEPNAPAATSAVGADGSDSSSSLAIPLSAPPSAAPPSAGMDGTPLSSVSVLLAEDDEFMCEAGATVLSQAGVGEVVVVTDGREALEQLASRSFTVALLDVNMPFMDGIECVRRLRENEEARADPRALVKAVTANADDPGTHAECLAAGFDEVLAKPIGRQRVEEFLAPVLTGKL
jgi:CheY-like chemotaxis protein